MIEVRGLTRYYGDFAAVDGVSFDIGQGEIVGLLGHNGAGKSTIMKIMTGCLEATRGEVTIDGIDVIADRERAQRLIGYLPEDCPAYPEMSVMDYLDYAAALHGVPEGERMERILDAVQKTELQPKATARISTLSRGYRQRVGVAQALLHRPAILVLDEPTNGLDPTQIHHMRDLIRALAENATVIISTHILQEVQAVCDRVIIVRAGLKVLDEPMSALREGRRVLVSLGADPGAATPLLAKVASVEKVEAQEGEGGRFDYALTLAEGAEPHAAAAEVARCAVEAKHDLYGLSLERRDLETIFGAIANTSTREEGGSSGA